MRLGPTTGANDSRIQELTVEKGTIHTKRHSGEDPIKNGYVTCAVNLEDKNMKYYRRFRTKKIKLGKYAVSDARRKRILNFGRRVFITRILASIIHRLPSRRR